MSAAAAQMMSGQAAAGAPGDDPPPGGKRGPPPYPTTPSKRRAVAKLPCCRCLRRLQTRKGKTGGFAGQPVRCVLREGYTRCGYCDSHRRAGAAGCVPCPPSLFGAAGRLVSMNRSLVAAAPGAPTQAEVEDAADALSRRMRVAGAAARRFVPGAPAVGGAASSPSSSAFRGAGAGAGDSLAPLLGMAVEALRVGVEMSARANNFAAPVWSDEVPSDEEVVEEEEEGEEEDEEDEDWDNGGGDGGA